MSKCARKLLINSNSGMARVHKLRIQKFHFNDFQLMLGIARKSKEVCDLFIILFQTKKLVLVQYF